MALITGTALANTLRGTTAADLIRGLAGNDTLYGGAGDDTLEGGTGRDVLSGDAGFDVVSYQSAGGAVVVDLLTRYGYSGDAWGDTYTGIEGVIGSAYGDELHGDAGNNRLVGLGGGDVLDGRGGRDQVSYIASPGAVSVNLWYGDAFGGDATGDLLIDIEDVEGSVFGDALYGSFANNSLKGDGGDDYIDGIEGNDSVDGDAGNDTLRGGEGNDSLYGDAGDDLMEGGLGADFVAGRAGIDTASYVDSTSGVRVDLTLNAGTGGDAAGDTFFLVENVWGSSYSDRLRGAADANVLRGGFGNDTLEGMGGNDTLIGDWGTDFMTGGAGGDTFRFIEVIDSNVYDGADQILDFVRGSDRIDLSAIDARQYLGGNEAFSFIGTGAFTGVAGQLRYFSSGGSTTIQGDDDGDRSADLTIVLQGSFTLAGSDFFL